MPAAFFVVRAIVTDASKRAAFDTWYETAHLPDAVTAFGVAKAWRFWSLDDPSLHQAMYQFDDEAKLAAMLRGDALKKLVADLNRDWPDVKRARDAGAGAGVCEVVPVAFATNLNGRFSRSSYRRPDTCSASSTRA